MLPGSGLAFEITNKESEWGLSQDNNIEIQRLAYHTFLHFPEPRGTNALGPHKAKFLSGRDLHLTPCVRGPLKVFKESSDVN